ncbi:MAG: TM2 domain-containing protein [Clostridia bacterium]|nr:TM2 domain-containing protein [Clostridia bacterium]
MFCEKCGTELAEGAKHCSNCGAPVGGQTVQNSNPVNNNGGESKSKLAAGLLGIFLGSLGIHNFYLGYTRNAVIQLVLCLAGFITCGLTSLGAYIWGLVEGIMIIAGKISVDANGVPLKD